ncbi:MAG: GNAT family N-acetyltransferase [Leptospiraceae bacterium]|nr:GNAT family N-acetyltransferase [Leptospiraceae bacterium]
MALQLIENKKGTERKLEVRLAENQLEIERTLSLRYSVFNEELGEGLAISRATQKDRDEYDYFCDHLVVVDKSQNNAVVGTYRILKRSTARENIGFYSETEFDLTDLYFLEDEVAEVGRSCVHPDYRDGSVISLLWAGLGEYMTENRIRYFMGCGSVHSTDVKSAMEAYAFMKSKDGILTDDRIRIKPRDTHRIHGFDPNYIISDMAAISKNIPPLLKGYLRLGAKVSGVPAIDLEFGTTDFFVFFDAKKINEKYASKFLKANA